MRKEEDKRKVVLYVTWPSEFKTYPKQKLEQAREATKGKVQTLLADHAEHVSFGDCKDNQGHLLPKILVFIRHSEASSMEELAPALRRVRYIDVGLEELVKTTLNKTDLNKLGIKPCCYTPACVQGQFVPAKNGRPARPAPKCDAGQRAYSSRICFSAGWCTISKTDRHADKRADEERRASAAREAISKAYRPMQECRAHEAGRCTKGDLCFESHDVPDCMILCCSMRMPKPGRKQRYAKCTSLRVGKDCPYSHEPVQEQTQEERDYDAIMFDEASDAEKTALEISQAEEAEKQSAEATAAATTAAAAAAARRTPEFNRLQEVCDAAKEARRGATAATAAAGAAAATAAAAAAVAAEAVVTAAAATNAVVANPGEWTGGNGPYPGGTAPLATPDQLAAQQALLVSQIQANHSIQQYESAPQPEADA